MAYATLEGRDLYTLKMGMPLAGAWVADVALEGTDALPATVALKLGGVTFRAGVRRQGQSLGATLARLVGGAGGLATQLKPQGYSGAPFSVPLQDILSAAGEKLAQSSDRSITTYQLASWSRPSAPAGHCLTELMRSAPLNALWRVLLDGTVWIGQPAWPAGSVDFEELLFDPAAGRFEVYAEQPDFLPGTMVEGIGRVTYVEHLLNEGKFRTLVWTE